MRRDVSRIAFVLVCLLAVNAAMAQNRMAQLNDDEMAGFSPDAPDAAATTCSATTVVPCVVALTGTPGLFLCGAATAGGTATGYIGVEPLVGGAFTPVTVADPYSRAVLFVNFNPPGKAACSELCITLEYEGTPFTPPGGIANQSWTLDLGNSTENNGFGGGSGGTNHVAEAQIQAQQFAIFGAFNPACNPGGAVNNLYQQNLALTDASIQICLRSSGTSLAYNSHYVRLGNPSVLVQQNFSTSCPELFFIPETTAAPGAPHDVYIGLNRVIQGPGGRIGSGLKRAYITLH